MSRPRVHSVDLLRGLIMVLMAIDHVREGQSGPGRNVTDPMDLAVTPMAVYVWRLLSHFCAPTFALLLGVSAFLSHASPRHLLVRGMVLIAMEFTLVSWAWTFNPAWPRYFWQIIAALGCASLALAAVVRLPHAAVATLGLAIVFGHNLFDGLHFTPGTAAHFVWSLLHDRNVLPLFAGLELRTSYPVLPILGLAFCGYGLAPHLENHVLLRRVGIAALAVFVLLRATGFHGDPHPWDGALRSFWNVTKYPLSLQFILLTTGPALLFLAAARRWRQPFLEQLGRVPMFFYLTHLAWIHILALTFALVIGAPIDFSRRFGGIPEAVVLPSWSFGPAGLVVALSLYPLCRWYERRRLRYL
jgi:uncharacterized membrane protein